ncbi:hypothetical protein GGX14DRAFT_647507 [Mycena pura]|uniref:Uncharacterized protein n=1 Tax=Mycena pura TaxID=153505 RepID=A0AAD6VDM2_9AGAR|nr:hypothetical protein GGX14DRAFT_647507 [Mycena pura]
MEWAAVQLAITDTEEAWTAWMCPLGVRELLHLWYTEITAAVHQQDDESLVSNNDEESHKEEEDKGIIAVLVAVGCADNHRQEDEEDVADEDVEVVLRCYFNDTVLQSRESLLLIVSPKATVQHIQIRHTLLNWFETQNAAKIAKANFHANAQPSPTLFTEKGSGNMKHTNPQPNPLTPTLKRQIKESRWISRGFERGIERGWSSLDTSHSTTVD